MWILNGNQSSLTPDEQERVKRAGASTHFMVRAGMCADDGEGNLYCGDRIIATWDSRDGVRELAAGHKPGPGMAARARALGAGGSSREEMAPPSSPPTAVPDSCEDALEIVLAQGIQRITGTMPTLRSLRSALVRLLAQATLTATDE